MEVKTLSIIKEYKTHGQERKTFAIFLEENEGGLNVFRHMGRLIPNEVRSFYLNSKKGEANKKDAPLIQKYEDYLRKLKEHNLKVKRIEAVISSFDVLALLHNPRKYVTEERKITLIKALDDLLPLSYKEDERTMSFIHYVKIIRDNLDDLILQKEILDGFENNLKTIEKHDGYCDKQFVEKTKTKELILQTMVQCLNEEYYEFGKIIPAEEAIKLHNMVFLSDHPDFVIPDEDK